MGLANPVLGTTFLKNFPMIVYDTEINGLIRHWCRHSVRLKDKSDWRNWRWAVELRELEEPARWCEEHFGPSIVGEKVGTIQYKLHYGNRWAADFETFYFTDLTEATLFKLRWYKS